MVPPFVARAAKRLAGLGATADADAAASLLAATTASRAALSAPAALARAARALSAVVSPLRAPAAAPPVLAVRGVEPGEGAGEAAFAAAVVLSPLVLPRAVLRWGGGSSFSVCLGLVLSVSAGSLTTTESELRPRRPRACRPVRSRRDSLVEVWRSRPVLCAEATTGRNCTRMAGSLPTACSPAATSLFPLCCRLRLPPEEAVVLVVAAVLPPLAAAAAGVVLLLLVLLVMPVPRHSKVGLALTCGRAAVVLSAAAGFGGSARRHDPVSDRLDATVTAAGRAAAAVTVACACVCTTVALP